jgi:uncharacterized protein YodC (DUF2158 family)
MAEQWKVGDVVRLKSGGPAMTVAGLGPYSRAGILCTWFDEKNKKSEELFLPDTLEREE